MNFGWSISDVVLLAQYSWKVYESFADGSYNATTEYECFKREYRQVITCLERLVIISPDLASLAGFDETFGDTIKFIEKHRVLTAKTIRPLITTLPSASNKIKDFLERVGHGYGRYIVRKQKSFIGSLIGLLVSQLYTQRRRPS